MKQAVLVLIACIAISCTQLVQEGGFGRVSSDTRSEQAERIGQYLKRRTSGSRTFTFTFSGSEARRHSGPIRDLVSRMVFLGAHFDHSSANFRFVVQKRRTGDNSESISVSIVSNHPSDYGRVFMSSQQHNPCLFGGSSDCDAVLDLVVERLVFSLGPSGP